MYVLPVLDLMNGQVVRGVAGRRAEYGAVRSRLTTSADPLDVAAAFRDHFGLTSLYLADLDAIAGAPPAIGIYIALKSQGFRLVVDAGLRTVRAAGPLLAAGVSTVVAGLETLAGPEVLGELLQEVGAARLCFSLDLKAGRPLAASAWNANVAWDIAEEVVGMGVRRLIILDLARVGVATGTGTESLCARVAAAFPDVAVLAGGGVRDRDDLERLRQLGVAGALVASALHDGRLNREDVRPITTGW
jgi:phosphoribosylformimino-5-aminoimidazole carboxamide ribotide isomerase